MNAPKTLRCEYLIDPLGIDAPRPRLSWHVDDTRRGARQTAYQILVTDPDGGATVWDSDQTPSGRSNQIAYAGPPLASRQRLTWKVRTWDAAHEPSPWSAAAAFEMGLLARTDWHAQWIGSPEQGGPYTPPPCPHLRKTVTVDKPVRRARLYVTALGLYEFHLNGRPVTDAQFLPGRTEYFNRIPYHTFDVTALLNEGPNALGAILGDGWYSGHIHSDPRGYYGDRPRLFAQLELTFTGDSTQTISTDASWKVTTNGPLRSSDILMGEDYDARLELPGWATPTYDDSAWTPVNVFPDPGIELVAAMTPPVRRTTEVRPIAPPTISANKRRWIFDLGQNIVGRVRLKIPADAAASRKEKPFKTIDLRHVEMLDREGKPYTQALRTARATDHYTMKCDGTDETYEPRFTFHGFRYVEVRDVPGHPRPDTVTGIVLHSDLEETGSFECSDPLLNRLHANIQWSQRGNFLEIPTDCPQRDERLGWTGDAQVFVRTAAFNMQVAPFFTKWLRIMRDDQGENGRIPSVVPHCPTIHNEGGPAWSDAAVICPWTIYRCYADTRILEENYPMMRKFMGFLDETCPEKIRPADGGKWKGYGDWLSPPGADTPPDLIGTAFWAHCAQLMSKTAAVLDKPDDAARYATLFDVLRIAWQHRFLKPDGSLTVPTQTAHVLALHFDLLPQDARPRAADALVQDISSRDTHLSTGFVGTPYLLDVLTRFGHTDVAYALLLQKTYPSWLYPVTLGATTMWERWDGWTPEKGFNDAGMNSYNHYAFGAVGHWMYSTIAGIDLDPDRPGYEHILLHPTPPPDRSLTHAEATLHSPHGPITSHWRIDGNMLHCDVTIPPNTTATLRLPSADPSRITESNRPAREADGVIVKIADDNVATLQLVAGAYNFRAPISP